MSPIAIPMGTQRFINRFKEARRLLEQRRGARVSFEDISNHMDLSPMNRRKIRSLALIRESSSFDAPLSNMDGNTDTTIGSLYADVRPGPEAIVIHEEMHEILGSCLKQLTSIEQQVVMCRQSGMTYTAIGKAIGFSRQRATQIYKKALQNLRALVQKNGIDGVE